jgi:hypothetical protein
MIVGALSVATYHLDRNRRRWATNFERRSVSSIAAVRVLASMAIIGDYYHYRFLPMPAVESANRNARSVQDGQGRDLTRYLPANGAQKLDTAQGMWLWIEKLCGTPQPEERISAPGVVKLSILISSERR